MLTFLFNLSVNLSVFKCLQVMSQLTAITERIRISMRGRGGYTSTGGNTWGSHNTIQNKIYNKLNSEFGEFEWNNKIELGIEFGRRKKYIEKIIKKIEVINGKISIINGNYDEKSIHCNELKKELKLFGKSFGKRNYFGNESESESENDETKNDNELGIEFDNNLIKLLQFEKKKLINELHCTLVLIEKFSSRPVWWKSIEGKWVNDGDGNTYKLGYIRKWIFNQVKGAFYWNQPSVVSKFDKKSYASNLIYVTCIFIYFFFFNTINIY